ALGRAGVVQHIVTRPAADRVARLTAAGLAVTPARFGGWWDWPTRRRIARTVESFRPEVVLAWMNRAASAMPDGPFAKVARLGGYYNLKYYQRCDGLICNTRAICDHVIAHGRDPSRVIYIPNFSPVGSELAVARASLATPPSARVLLILARLETSKGIDLAIRALAKIPDAMLWIAGEGSLRRELETVAVQSGVAARVRFLGWRADRTALLRAADIVLVPSRSEPFGNVVVNAWAHQKPLIAARADGPSALIRDGADGLLVPTNDAEALAAAISQLLADPGKMAQLAAAGLSRAQSEFSESVVVTQYIDTLNALAHNAFADTEIRPPGDLPANGGGA
ncbi:MAG: glycosyltransferase, partial [Rhodobacteraceae bacterium]|nr:glycosyltransferase [Paracoccaceae bacterium]